MFSAIFFQIFLRVPIFLRIFAPSLHKNRGTLKAKENMEEKKYHIEESEIAGDKVCEPSPAYRSAASSALSVSSVSWDEAYDTDSYPMGRSLEQVMEHCESILDKLDDPNYGEPISVLDAEIEKMIAEWK